MKNSKPVPTIIATVIILALALPSLAPERTDQDVKKYFTILAQRYAYTPNRIEVNLGDEIHIRLGALDAVHGFYLEGYDLEAEVQPGRLEFKARKPATGNQFNQVEEIVFIADRTGKFRYRCSVTCGTLHPFMLGELIVHPNRSLFISTVGIAGVLLVSLSMMVLASYSPTRFHNDSLPVWRLDLLKIFPGLRKPLTGRLLQFLLMLVCLAAFTLFIIAGFFGSPIGNRNIIITIVWILWWFLLIVFMVPFGARIWCMMCPFPFFGEWFQRKTLLGPGKDPDSEKASVLRKKGRKWPCSISNIWLQNLLFLTMCTFSTILVTRPVVTAWLLSGLALAAFLVHVVFRNRTFCSYLCPIGGWMSVYSKASMLEIRSRDKTLCSGCREKSCARGNEKGWGCPWDLFPGKLDCNNNCGMCLECIKSCRNSNMTVRVRPFCSDTRTRSIDQAWMVFIMMSLCLIYTTIFFGPWGAIKGWANISEVGDWQGFFIYVAGMWLTCLIVTPLLWLIGAWSAKKLTGPGGPPVREIFLSYSYILVPLGLLSWVAFSIPLVMVNYKHITASLSDPLGWGWDLFGTADDHWKPLFSEYMYLVQVPLVLTGLWFSLNRGFVIARHYFSEGFSAMISLLPFGGLTTAITLLLVIMYTG